MLSDIHVLWTGAQFTGQ